MIKSTSRLWLPRRQRSRYYQSLEQIRRHALHARSSAGYLLVMNKDQNSPADKVRQISLHQAVLLANIGDGDGLTFAPKADLITKLPSTKSIP